MKMSAYLCCCLYRALKLHFTTEYDFNKYHGKVRYTVDQFHKNKHKYVYEKLSKKFSDEDLKKFFIANFLQNETVWVQDLLSQEAHENFVTFNKKQQSLSYIFENDLLNIFGEENHKKLFNCNSSDFPLLLTKMLRNEVSPETVIIMNEFMEFVPKWDKNIKDDYIWPRVKTKMLKYKPFLEYDKSKFKKTLIETVKEFA
jgi:hypothetical protein